MMMKTLLAATAAASLVACVKQDAPPEGIARAIPTADQVAIKLPGGSSNARVGDLAQWYVATRGVTRTFNGGSGWVLVLIHTIVQFPVTSVDGNVYTWGPFSDGPLDPAEYKLDVTDNGDGTYAYQLSGRAKTGGAGFEVVIDGKADTRKGDLQGNGEFLVDFDAGRRVNPIDAGDARGSVDVHYDLEQKHLDLLIMSTDDKGQPVMADYAYNEDKDGNGNMVFDVNGDAGGGAAQEQITLRSRWLVTGAGRADARIAGGDLGAQQVTASECWGTMFQRLFYSDSANFAPAEGAEADCAFKTPDLPPVK